MKKSPIVQALVFVQKATEAFKKTDEITPELRQHLKEMKLRLVVHAQKQGMNQREISEVLKVTPGRISQLTTEADELGLIK